ncbi:MAG: hypothetical protein OHK93_005878 [Ramalina farinacea]|uniref:Uncharacterized protein n=1 Tax=Ramalina farinacea TaxID=258253 RepID=A0AA43TPK0_9LECA|nr:hypothetical protein [Ramalina farinacea]
MPKQNASLAAGSGNDPVAENILVSDLRQDANVWYKVLVLLYDFSNFAKDAQSEMRLNCTTHMLYISEPYFDQFEAQRILKATLDVDEGCPTVSVEETIHGAFENFAKKRKASGDARPCGPHGLLPVYCDVFGVTKDQLRDEKFLSRLRRSGIGARPSIKTVPSLKNEGTDEKHAKPNVGKKSGGKKT